MENKDERHIKSVVENDDEIIITFGKSEMEESGYEKKTVQNQTNCPLVISCVGVHRVVTHMAVSSKWNATAKLKPIRVSS